MSNPHLSNLHSLLIIKFSNLLGILKHIVYYKCEHIYISKCKKCNILVTLGKC